MKKNIYAIVTFNTLKWKWKLRRATYQSWVALIFTNNSILNYYKEIKDELKLLL